MQFAIDNENKITITGKRLSIQPIVGGFVVTQGVDGEQASLTLAAPKPERRGRRSSKVQEGVATLTGAVPGPRDDSFAESV